MASISAHGRAQENGHKEAMALDCAPAGPGSSHSDSHSDVEMEEPSVMRDPLAHINAIEQDGLSMLDLIEAMKADAKNQDELISVIAKSLEDTVKRNDELGRVTEMKAFEGDKAPITPSSYVRRLMKYGGCSPCCLAIGLIYLERLKRRINSVCLTSNNFQRLFLVAVMTAAKFLDDFYYSNKHWAEVGGIPNKELNNLETEFLFRLSFSLYITREEYDAYTSLFSESDESQVTTSKSAPAKPSTNAPSRRSSSSPTISSNGPKGSVSPTSSKGSVSPTSSALARVKGMGTKVSSYTDVTSGAMAFS
ncbi:cyclin-domain-containing protein [Baffinella frigidus]|nr:cyclin-domain-containing protein [Cryptophyta sp. CCMP2293]